MYQGFLLSQAQENMKTAKENRAVAERRKQRAADQVAKLKKFEPILSLEDLKEMTVDKVRAERIKEQLSWHRKIGGDVNIPKGFHKFRKGKAWVAMVQAVRRHLRGKAHQKIKGVYNQHT